MLKQATVHLRHKNDIIGYACNVILEARKRFCTKDSINLQVSVVQNQEVNKIQSVLSLYFNMLQVHRVDAILA